MQTRPAVGVAVIIVKKGKALLGKRLNSHGDGTWAFPGGHLELNESIEDCAKREVFEETGLVIQHVEHAAVTNDIFTRENKHYVTVFMLARYESGEPRLKEPKKCAAWQWFHWDDLPEPLFLSLENLLKLEFKLPHELV